MEEEIPAASKDGKSDCGSNKDGKRTIVLGVVDISGIKRASTNRKRRWDQPPLGDGDEGEEEVDGEVPSKIVVKEDVNKTCDVDAQNEIFFDAKSELSEPMSNSNIPHFPVNMDDIPLPDSSGQSDVSDTVKETKSLETASVLLDEIPIPNDEMTPTVHSANESELVKKEVSTISQKHSEKKSVPDMPPIKAIISDSLKQIQSCYDEDSNSSESSYVDSHAELPSKIDFDSGDGGVERIVSDAPSVDQPQDSIRELRTERSPTPVLEFNSNLEMIVGETAQKIVDKGSGDLLEAASIREPEPENVIDDLKIPEQKHVDSTVQDVAEQPGLEVFNSRDVDETSSNDVLQMSSKNEVFEQSIGSDLPTAAVEMSQTSGNEVVQPVEPLEEKDVSVANELMQSEVVENDVHSLSIEKSEGKPEDVPLEIVRKEDIEGQKDSSIKEKHADISQAILDVSEQSEVDPVKSVAVENVDQLNDTKVGDIATSPKVETVIPAALKSTDLLEEVVENAKQSDIVESLGNNSMEVDEIVVNEVTKETGVEGKDMVEPQQPETLPVATNDLEVAINSKSLVFNDITSNQLKDQLNNQQSNDVNEEKSLSTVDVPVKSDADISTKTEESEPSTTPAGKMDEDLGSKLLDKTDDPQSCELKSGTYENDSRATNNQAISELAESMDVHEAIESTEGVSKSGLGSENVDDVTSRVLMGEKDINPNCTGLDSSREASDSANNLESSQAIKMLDESTEKEAVSTEPKPSNQTISIMDNSQNCVGFDDLSCKTPSKSLEVNFDQNPVNQSVTMHFASVRALETEDDEKESTSPIGLKSANSELVDKSMDFEEQANIDLNTMDMLDSLVRRSSMDDQRRASLRDGLLSEDSLINEINQLPDKEEEESKKCEVGEDPIIEGIFPNESNKSPTKNIAQEGSIDPKNQGLKSAETEETVATLQLEGSRDNLVHDNPTPEISSNVEEVGKEQEENDDSKLQLRDEEIEMSDAEIVTVDPTKSLSGEDSDNDGETISCEDGTATIADSAPVSVDVPVKEVLIGSEEPSFKKAKKVKQPRPIKVAKKQAEFNEDSLESKVPKEDKSSESQSKADKIPDSESLSTKEPILPVLIIKKQSLPSARDGDKTETLTCSPKSVESIDSSKKHHELLHIETGGEALAETRSPKHSPITLRIFKDNLTVKTDLDSPKRNKSPLSSEFKSELSPHLKSPIHSDSLSPQTKQLEFTLKIAKDVTTNQPKATMSPKNVASPSSIWKSEVPSPEGLSSMKDVEEVQLVRSGRGRGRTPRGSRRGRGRRGGSLGVSKILTLSDQMAKTQDDFQEQLSKAIAKPELITEDSGTASSSASEQRVQMHDLFRQIITKDSESKPTSGIPGVDPLTPIKRKRGRPRKNPLSTPLEPIVIKTEPDESLEASLIDGLPTTPLTSRPYTPSNNQELESPSDSGTSGRPKRTCRGRTKPIVVKKRKPRGGGMVGNSMPRVETPIFSPALIEIKQEPTTPVPLPECGDTSSSSITPTILADPSPSPAFTPPGRGRGGFKRPTPDRNTLSEKELAELQKIEAKKEKLRLDRIAKYEAKKAKKLAKKLKDEERRKRLAREKAEKAEAAAPQVFEEETRMSAPDSGSRGHTPAPNRFGQGESGIGDESQNSISTPGDTNKGNKKGRMEISITDLDCLIKEIRVDDLAEYQWQGSELYMIQEQVSLYLGVKSFKRKYPGVKRRPVEAEERTFLEDSGLVPKSMCDLGLTAVSSAEILDIMYQDFPDKYEEFRKHVRDKQAREASFKQKAAIGLQKKDGTKVEPREQALEAVAAWNANLNRERREERRCALDLQTFTVHYPKLERNNMKKPTPKLGLYPVAVIPGQYSDHFKKYTPTELMYFPINTVIYGPLKPNERHKETGSDDGSNSESSSSSSSSSSSGESSSESESEGEDPPKCSMCSGTKKKNKDSVPEILLSCFQCKACYHPSCKDMTPEMTPHLTKYEWLCTACKKCSKCTDPNLKDRIMCCQLCDRGYHLTCIGLKKMPEGRWHCSVCAYCSSCGSRSPGGSDWQHEFKKGEKGAKIYQRTLCTPCFKLWRKGKYCQLCSKCHSMKPEEDPNLIQCNSCDRWIHKECYSSKYGVQSKLLNNSSIQCDICVERIQSMVNSPLARPLIKV